MDDVARPVHDLRAHHDRFLGALRTMGERLLGVRDRAQIISDLLSVTAAFLEAPTSVFYARMAGSGRLRPTHAIGIESVANELGPDEGVAGHVATTGVPYAWSAEAQPTTTTAPSPSAAEPAGTATTVLAVPVQSGGRPFGVLAFYGRGCARPFDDDDRAALAVLVQQAESAVESSFLYDDVARLSLTDGLTGLWNRRQFDLRAASELSRAIRFSEPFAVLFADIDAFKTVNDTRGHQAGDTVLVEVARRLTGATREVDLVARYGGEEFTLLLPRTGLDGATRLAEKVRAAIEHERFTVDDGDPLALTISVGVAAYPEHGATGKELLASADKALYRAKSVGGNQVEQATAEGGPRA